ALGSNPSCFINLVTSSLAFSATFIIFYKYNPLINIYDLNLNFIKIQLLYQNKEFIWKKIQKN
ncbi:MAG: hypothetical protein CMC58_05225, partial [Flavobacteriaceae bacterium]|nr:hypothetical protein [Flavobacteriaceae bacterium]